MLTSSHLILSLALLLPLTIGSPTPLRNRNKSPKVPVTPATTVKSHKTLPPKAPIKSHTFSSRRSGAVYTDPFEFQGGYWRPKTSAIDLLGQPGIGGTQVVIGAASMKRDIAIGIMDTLPKYQDEFTKWGMQGDPSLAQHVIAEAAFETSMGLHWPTQEDQTKETNPNIPKTKWGTLSQEIGPMRMNRDMLLSLNYTEDDIITMNSKTVAGNMMAGESWVKALAVYGEMGFYFFHRGGRGRWNQFRNQTLNSTDAMDTWQFLNGIYSYQLTMLTHKLDTTTDVVPWSSKNVPWI